MNIIPSNEILIKLSSIVIHTEEMLDSNGHSFDTITLQALLQDTDLQAWIKKLNAMGLVPVKRN